jgi:hypothetical protein
MDFGFALPIFIGAAVTIVGVYLGLVSYFFDERKTDRTDNYVSWQSATKISRQ